jgi:hypothetical protein
VREGRISQLDLYALCFFSISGLRYSEAMVFACHGVRRAEEAISVKVRSQGWKYPRYVAIDALFRSRVDADPLMYAAELPSRPL